MRKERGKGKDKKKGKERKVEREKKGKTLLSEPCIYSKAFQSACTSSSLQW